MNVVFQELNTSLGLLSNSLEVLNQFCMQAGNSAHTNRIKNIIHHEMLSAKVQWEHNKTDTRFYDLNSVCSVFIKLVMSHFRGFKVLPY